ncbi:peptide methionine sulfoxide reductase msrB/msrA [Blumeria hordei DH14]|uniref:peptide-methionine (S)-S-oxide reductase n=1 Tax=Blumeria graminis f. sp. hordei (strain DH14) TaxID=546991 RepID=N1JQ84_BLUG1|nr:peptide methionine sulfoxide reductase msrB/msrA [Blumeria hordei DH14]
MSFARPLISQPFLRSLLTMSGKPVCIDNSTTAAQKATFAAGCFWGVEKMFRESFASRGLVEARVGYTGGLSSNPLYRAVCSGQTGHSEALQVTFDPQKVSYRQLVEFFYQMHDPTTFHRQGADQGSQYRSAIFYHNQEQEQVARQVTQKVNEQWWKNKVTTEIVPAGEWWDAEQYHQQYLNKNPGGYECPNHVLRKFPPLL